MVSRLDISAKNDASRLDSSCDCSKDIAYRCQICAMHGSGHSHEQRPAMRLVRAGCSPVGSSKGEGSVSDGVCAEIESLEAFAFEQGGWRSWTLPAWNEQLLLYCFVRDHARAPDGPLRATLLDLPLLVADPSADPETMAEHLVLQLRGHARQHHNTDPLSRMAQSSVRFNPRGAQPPDFFAFLWITCLIANGYPDADGTGLFHQRFERVFPLNGNGRGFSKLPGAWEKLSEWLDSGHQFAGFPYRPLELPPEDSWRSNISHSWWLAFPTVLDRRILLRSLEGLQERIDPLQASNPAVVRALLSQSGFSSGFREELRRLLSSDAGAGRRSAWFSQFLEQEIRRMRRTPSLQLHSVDGFGPLVLRSMGYALGTLLLADGLSESPAGLLCRSEQSWLPGRSLLVPEDPDDQRLAAFDAGSLAIDPQLSPLTGLHPWLERGLLPFGVDPDLGLPRMLLPVSTTPVSHVLVRKSMLELFQEHFDARAEPSDEDHWLCFSVQQVSLAELLRFPDEPLASQETAANRIRTFGGLRLSSGEGFLASGLGLPQVRVHGPEPALKVVLLAADGTLVEYETSDTEDPQEWKPERDARRTADLGHGQGRLVTFFSQHPTVERSIELTAMGPRAFFRRDEPLAWREDWGRFLGSLELARPNAEPREPGAEALEWARQRLNSRERSVNPLFEEQMLDSLCSLFERHSSLPRHSFHELHKALIVHDQEWPLFAASVLRGWCEGGWLEEGLERRRFRWRIQPVDPRLVLLNAEQAQLVGLLPSRGLMQLLAHAFELGFDVQMVPPACPEMPRGWRFIGPIKLLCQRSALPLVGREQWNADAMNDDWIVDIPLPSDGPEWPISLGYRLEVLRICDQRKGAHRPLGNCLDPRAPRSLAIEQEISRYGRRRYHSHDPDHPLSSCHRNRVALHALTQATNGSWPFGITSRHPTTVDRLYDADAFLPLPLGRHSALTGSQMPGPTRPPGPNEHTYRYSFDAAFAEVQREHLRLPLSTV